MHPTLYPSLFCCGIGTIQVLAGRPEMAMGAFLCALVGVGCVRILFCGGRRR